VFSAKLQSDIDAMILSSKKELDCYLQEIIDDYEMTYVKWANGSFLYSINDKFSIDENFLKVINTAQKKLRKLGLSVTISFSQEFPMEELRHILVDDLIKLVDKYKDKPYVFSEIRRARFYIKDIR
jgi:hypothetical protein